MAMTGGTSVLLHTGYGNGQSNFPIKLYAYYKHSQVVATNQSTVLCGMYITTPVGWNIGEWTDHAPAGSYIGTTSNIFSGTIPAGTDGTYWIAENQSFTVDHNSNGTGSATIYWKLDVNSPWGGFVYPSGYFNITLPTIPRQATITSISDFTDVDNPAFTFSNPGGFIMDVWLEPNPVGDHLCVRENIPNTGSYTWELSDEDRDALRNSCVGNQCPIRVGLYTTIGNTVYHDYRDKTFTMTENTATKPSVSMVVSLNNGSLPSKFNGLYIQGKSRLNVNISATPKYGAKITSYSAKVDGKTYSLNQFTTDVITASGNVLGYAKDSRGFTGEATRKIDVIPYSKPLVVPIGNDNAISCYRSDGNGMRVGNSTSVWIKAKMTYYSVEGNNSCALQWRRKLITEAWDDQIHLWDDLNTSADEYNALLSGEVFDKKKSYTVQIRAIDDIGEYDLKTFEIPTEDVALHLGAGGKNVAVGTYCNGLPEYRFYSDWVGQFDKGLWGTSINFNVTDVLTFPEECTDGITPIVINSSTNKANLPSGNYDYCVGIIHKRAADQYNVILMDYMTGKIAINVHLSGTWTGWKYITPQ